MGKGGIKGKVQDCLKSQDGEYFIVTQDVDNPPRPDTHYGEYRLYRGNGAKFEEVPVTSAGGRRDGGSMTLDTKEGRLLVDKSLQAQVTGNPDHSWSPSAGRKVNLTDAPLPMSLAPRDDVKLATERMLDTTFGNGLGKRLLEEEEAGIISTVIIRDKGTGRPLGMEIMVKDPGRTILQYEEVTVNKDGTKSSHPTTDGATKIFINASDDATLVLDAGKPADFVDKQGHSLTNPVPQGVKTAYDTPVTNGRTNVVLLSAGGKPGKFAIRGYDSADINEINLSSDGDIEMSKADVRNGRMRMVVSGGADATLHTPSAWGEQKSNGALSSVGPVDVQLEGEKSKVTIQPTKEEPAPQKPDAGAPKRTSASPSGP